MQTEYSYIFVKVLIMLHICLCSHMCKKNDSAECTHTADGDYLWKAEFWVLLNHLYYTPAMFKFVQLIT